MFGADPNEDTPPRQSAKSSVAFFSTSSLTMASWLFEAACQRAGLCHGGPAFYTHHPLAPTERAFLSLPGLPSRSGSRVAPEAAPGRDAGATLEETRPLLRHLSHRNPPTLLLETSLHCQISALSLFSFRLPWRPKFGRNRAGANFGPTLVAFWPLLASGASLAAFRSSVWSMSAAFRPNLAEPGPNSGDAGPSFPHSGQCLVEFGLTRAEFGRSPAVAGVGQCSTNTVRSWLKFGGARAILPMSVDVVPPSGKLGLNSTTLGRFRLHFGRKRSGFNRIRETAT